MDDPEKAQYAISDLRVFGGADRMKLLEPSMTQRVTIRRDICEFVRQKAVTEPATLMNYCLDEAPTEWLDVYCMYSRFINSVIRSPRHIEEKKSYYVNLGRGVERPEND